MIPQNDRNAIKSLCVTHVGDCDMHLAFLLLHRNLEKSG